MIVFVTGASVGFGAAIAERYAAAGHRVVATARRTERLNELRARYPQLVHPVTLDVREREAVQRAVRELPAELSAVDVLVNNAGLALGLEPAQQADLAAWEDMVDTNIKGLMYVTHALLPGMVKRNRGHIVNLGSIAGTYAYPGGNVYGASKAFVRQFSFNLRSDLLGTRVRVSNVEPGMSEGTEFSVVRFRGDAQRAEQVYRGTDALRAEDIAETVFWITSLPERVNINAIELMPVTQSFGPTPVHRDA